MKIEIQRFGYSGPLVGDYYTSKRSLIGTKEAKAVLVDVTECEIERPKKTERLLFRQEEEAYTESPDCCRRFDSGCSLYFRGQRQPT